MNVNVQENEHGRGRERTLASDRLVEAKDAAGGEAAEDPVAQRGAPDAAKFVREFEQPAFAAFGIAADQLLFEGRDDDPVQCCIHVHAFS